MMVPTLAETRAMVADSLVHGAISIHLAGYSKEAHAACHALTARTAYLDASAARVASARTNSRLAWSARFAVITP